ncbi:hypothetical protein MED15_03802 [Micromonospora noduli]|uniref:RNA polymerase sigma-70 region 4 domain-containing protein n=1 Tax=Micromonospora noduli TaxID=709876 RepID=A0ABX9D1H1_9ACTN|nr:hypothetical protein [Micromonospora noduli]RAO16283.1 hypothetical protein MED15_03802 [Micromonospora noduli]
MRPGNDTRTSDQLRQELLDLRRGPGLQSSPLHRRLGPRLADLCGVSPAEPESAVRAKVRATLLALSADLPGDLRRAVVLAYALDPVHDYLRLDRRTDQLARELSVQQRTARRRIDEAVARLVRAAVPEIPTDPTDAGPGWHLRAMNALLRLDTLTPELYEARSVVAIRPIDELTVQFSLPRQPNDDAREHGVHADVLFGARIRELTRHNSGQYLRLTLALPRTLEPGERHDLCLHYRLPEGQPMREHYVFQPLAPCAHCTVRLRFPTGGGPATAWRLNGVPPRAVDERTPGPDRLRPDAVGEVTSAFDGLQQGYAYGIAWTFADGSHT